MGTVQKNTPSADEAKEAANSAVDSARKNTPTAEEAAGTVKGKAQEVKGTAQGKASEISKLTSCASGIRKLKGA